MGYNTRRTSAEKTGRRPREADAISVEDDSGELAHDLGLTTGDDDMNVDEGDYEEEAEDDDARSSDSESETWDSRSEGELEDLALEMRELERSANLAGMFQLVDRLGDGTFSTVYKAIDLHHTMYDNSEWRPDSEFQLPTPAPTSAAWVSSDELAKSRPKGKVYVALKRIYVSSSPVRIQNELDILGRLRGCPNVAYLISAVRFEDQVIAAMPYEKHQDFRDYFRTASMGLIRSYFWCLLSGLAGAHEHGILHRDIKPANFLFNARTGQGTVCDFGLAEVFKPIEWHGYCLHSLPLIAASLPHGLPLDKPRSTWQQCEDAVSKYGPDVLPFQLDDWDNERLCEMYNRYEDEVDVYASWERPKKPIAGSRVGYLRQEHDKRPSIKANRAGTRGFRAPEVLFKCTDQTVAIDIWSVGVTLLCFLTRRFPFFNSNDDTEALMEIACIVGKNRMERCGMMHNRVFITNVPSVEQTTWQSLHELVRALNPNIWKENRPPNCAADDAVDWYADSDLFLAVDLMKRCLTLDCSRRITAEKALLHPFFANHDPSLPPH